MINQKNETFNNKNIKIVTIVGTRPQFIKMTLISNLFKKHNINEIVIHSGQHYDHNMSEIFFDELNIIKPNYHLQLNNDNKKFGEMIMKISDILVQENPSYILVYGDCDTSLAGALAGNKLNIPIIHIESGLRSFDMSMPEEVNRKLIDHISDILFCPTEYSKQNLINENINKYIFVVGDLQIDLLRKNLKKIKNIEEINDKINSELDEKSKSKSKLKLKSYGVLTLHRKSNKTVQRLKHIFEELNKLFNKYPELKIVWPIHPGTLSFIKSEYFNLHSCFHSNLIIIEPLNYIDMLSLLSSANFLITDSGGLQKEAYELNIKTFTIRKNTEWIETIKDGNNVLCYDNIFQNIDPYIKNDIKCESLENIYVKEKYLKNSSEKIIEILISLLYK